MADDIVTTFLSATRGEDAKLAKGLDRLEDEANAALAAVLDCFDADRDHALDDQERALARRVLAKLHRPSVRGLEQLGAVLVRLGGGQAPGRQEMGLAVEILELFCRADSVNDTLSQKELDMLLAVLAHIDTDGDGVISAEERSRLRDQLWDADGFLAEQKQNNPVLRKLIG